jgi:hypothetical protein
MLFILLRLQTLKQQRVLRGGTDFTIGLMARIAMAAGLPVQRDYISIDCP